jgi:two-component system chemotaxis sensor kinase CheA
MENMGRLIEEIRDTALGLRMVQISGTFNKFRRTVRDICQQLGKQVELDITGGETELDRAVVEKLADPLMHLVRNAIDHGIETAAERQAAGKNPTGKLGLHAYHDSGHIVIEVKDDGRGLNRDKILAKAKERNLVSNDATMTDSEVYKLIFEPGFSTADQVTDISGRGVGMDVVRRNIESVRGHIDIDSQAGHGSTLSIRLPLTLAIIDGFLIKLGKSFYVIPLNVIEECTQMTASQAEANVPAGCIELHGEVFPVIDLVERFGEQAEPGQRQNVVVARFAGHKVGLVVNELLGEYQTVIKPLGRIFNRLSAISGATILGTGAVALILDVPALITQISNQREALTETQ